MLRDKSQQYDVQKNIPANVANFGPRNTLVGLI